MRNIRNHLFQRLLIFMAIAPLLSQSLEARGEVILLHGLCRTSRSMIPMAKALTLAGYTVRNVDYPSRSASIAQLAETAVGQAVADCERDGATKIDFVTHSLGGILVRRGSQHTRQTALAPAPR